MERKCVSHQKLFNSLCCIAGVRLNGKATKKLREERKMEMMGMELQQQMRETKIDARIDRKMKPIIKKLDR